jgi:phage-related protein
MNLFELFVKIGADTSEADKGIDETGKKTSGLGEKIKNGLATVGKAAVVGVTAAATAIGTIGTKAIQAYADYEQLVGGVETLFGTSAGSAEEYAAQTGEAVDDVRMKWASLSRAQNIIMYRAQNAFKTAGLSANEYMETVTSFAAALVSSMGGDTEAAAQRADLAITDMADNANKMGSSMESIQNAYQGFAKQNYSMLDNLKLGYGGTAKEMYRLLSDAKEIDETFDAVFSLDEKGHLEANYSDIVQAIHIVQTEMGITGTTAKEAASTIQGSFGMVKAAWQNLVTGLADPEQDLGALVGNFTDSVVIAGNNLIPRIQELLPRIVEAVTSLVGTVSEQLPALLESVLPSLIEGATSLIAGLMAALPAVLAVLGDVAPTVIGILVPALIDLLPQIVQTGIDVIVSLVQGISEAMPELIPAATEAILEIVDTLTNPDNIGKLVDAALKIILTLADGIIDAVPRLLEVAPKIIENLVTALIENFPKIIESGVKLVASLSDGLIKSIPQLTETAPKLIIGIVQGILDNLPEIIMSGPKIIMALIEGLISAIPDLVQAVPTLIKSIVDTFLNYDWGSIGRNIVSGIKNGVSNTWNGLKSGVGTAVNGLVGGVESILGIASPSKVFARIGGYMAEGLGQGFDREMTDIRKNIEDQMTFGTTSFSVSGAAKSSVGVVNGLLANNQPGTPMQINLVLDGQTIARAIFDPLRGEIVQRGVSLA